MAWTSDDLVTQVRLEGWLPDADDLSSAQILSLADAQLQSIVSGRLKVAKEEHWVVTEDLSATAQRIRLPRRCLARAVRRLVTVEPSGNVVPFTLISPDDAVYLGATSTVTPTAGYLEGEHLVLLGTPAAGYSIRVSYLRRPSRLVLTTDCATIYQAAAPATLQAHLASVPAGVGTAGAIVDIVRGEEPFDLLYTDIAVNFSGGSWTLLGGATIGDDIASPLDIAPGERVDYVCPRDQTCYPPLPSVLWGVLVAATVKAIHVAQQNAERAALADATLQERIADARALMEPRSSLRASLVRLSSPLRLAGGGGRPPWR